MKLENWAVVCKNPYSAPEMCDQHFMGEVYGHARFEDGEEITTSTVVDYKDGKFVTRSGSEYELGKVRGDYARLYPNAKERAINSMKRKEKK